MEQRDENRHDDIRQQYDAAASLFEEGMVRMALYHRHCQDPVIFRIGRRTGQRRRHAISSRRL